MTKFDLNDDSLVVIVGSGAGGGTLGNELAQKGVKTVILEAGDRNEIAGLRQRRMGQLRPARLEGSCAPRRATGAWLAISPTFRPGSSNRSAVHDRALGRRLAALRAEHEFKIRTTYGNLPVREPARLADHQGDELDPWYAKGRGQDGRDPDQRDSRPSRQQQFQGARSRRPQARLQGSPHRPHGDQQRAARRPRLLPADRLLLPGLQVRRQMVHALHRDPQGRGHRKPGGPPRQPRWSRSSTTRPAR